MNEAIIYDAVRTPRGKGKKSGSLNEVPPVQLASKVLKAIEKRNNINIEKQTIYISKNQDST